MNVAAISGGAGGTSALATRPTPGSTASGPTTRSRLHLTLESSLRARSSSIRRRRSRRRRPLRRHWCQMRPLTNWSSSTSPSTTRTASSSRMCRSAFTSSSRSREWSTGSPCVRSVRATSFCSVAPIGLSQATSTHLWAPRLRACLMTVQPAPLRAAIQMIRSWCSSARGSVARRSRRSMQPS